METRSIKALSMQLLQGNRHGNQKETTSFPPRKPEGKPANLQFIHEYENDGKNLPHYYELGNGWCSEKLPDSNYPAGCIRLHCEHYHASQNAPQMTTEEQGILALQ